jgi:hypothetical protein
MKKEYDVTIVGEEPAGSTTAKFLAEKEVIPPKEKMLEQSLLHSSLSLIWYGDLNLPSTPFHYRNTNTSFNVMQNINI